MKKLIALLMCITIISTLLVGCGDKKSSTVQPTQGSDFAFNEAGNTVEDSSELPDWKGKKIDLRVYYALGADNNRMSHIAKNDVVTPELERITGIKYSDSSFENVDEFMDTKISKMMATNDLPDVIINPDRSVLQRLIEADMVYDLTQYFPKYCTNLVKYYQNPGMSSGLKSDRSDGKLYYFYSTPYDTAIKFTEPDMPKSEIGLGISPADSYPYVYIRDDILKKLYPKAKTQNEIEEIYLQKGQFTKDEILDVTFKSTKEFYDFLYKVKDLGLKEGSKEIMPFYARSTSDNWSLFSMLGGLFGYNPNGANGSPDANYYTYWDKETKKVEIMYKQPFFKEALKGVTKLVQDGVASKEALIDNRAAFEQKMNSGLYAVLYGVDKPNNDVYEQSGKNYKYRKVYLTIPQNADKFLFTETKVCRDWVAILKKNVNEEDIPQILRYYDFAASKAGQKLSYWGPKSAGLFDEVNGVRTYKDKELENCMLYGSDNKKNEYYNLDSKAWPGYPVFASSKYNPKFSTAKKRTKGDANIHFSIGRVEELDLIESISPNIWEFESFGVKGVQNFWKARTSFEEALVKIFVSQNDAEFEKFYGDMVNLGTKIGLDDATMEEVNKVYVENVNKEYMSNLK